MAITQSDIDSMTAAIVAGVRSVTIGGQTVTYNTSSSMLEARDRLQAEFNAQGRSTPRPKQSFGFQSGRGYD